jgi:hypothetical protein
LIDRFEEPAPRLSGGQWGLRVLLFACLLALAWWAMWVFDPGNLGGPAFLFAVVVAAQILDLLVVLGFWHAIWPRRRPLPSFAPVRGRASLLVLTRRQPVQVVEQTLQAAVAVRRRQRVFLADPFDRPELGWLAGWYGARRLSPEMEELDELAGARFLAVIEAGQVPRPEFLERLLPYFADRNLALVQAWCSRRARHRSGTRDAILRGGDAVGEARCLGSNYVLRRSALHGGFGPSATSLAGALRMARALRAGGWRVRYAGERLTDSLGPSGLLSRLADARRRAAAELAVGLLPGSRRRGVSTSARFHNVWAAVRYPALVGLPVSAAAVAAYAALQPLPLSWAPNLAVHLVPYLVLRAAVRVVVALRRPPRELTIQRSEPAAAAGVERQREAEPELADLLPVAPELQPEPHMGLSALSSGEGGPASEAPSTPESEPASEPASESGTASAEQLPLPHVESGRRPRALRTAVAVAAAWIVTTGAIGGAAFAVIRSNPPARPAPIHGSSVPPYSYYAPVQAPPGGAQPSR